jgi:quercetin dioxygenase-like cupin family protein
MLSGAVKEIATREEISMSAAVPVLLQEGQGEQLWFAGGGVFTMKVTAQESDGALILLEDRMVRGKTTPLHMHPSTDELLYILDGEIIAHVDGEDHPVGKGGVFFAPRGLPHAFMVTSETAHVIALMTPGNGESFYRSASEPVRTAADADPSRPPDWIKLREAAEQSETIVILGPSPYAATPQEPVAASL